MMFTLLNLLFASISIFFSFYLAAALSPQAFVIFNSWKQSLPLLTKLVTFNSQALLTIAAKENSLNFTRSGLWKFILDNALPISFVLACLLFGMVFFKEYFLNFFGNGYLYLLILSISTPFMVFILSSFIYDQRPSLFWCLTSSWSLLLGISYYLYSRNIIALIIFPVCLIFFYYVLKNKSGHNFEKSPVVYGWSAESLIGASELTLTLATLQLFRILLTENVIVGALDFSFSIIYLAGTFITNYYGYYFFSKQASQIKKNQLRVFFIYLIIFGVALFFVMLQIGLIEQFYSFFQIHHYFMPQILISVVLVEGLRLCSAIYYYEVLRSRNTKYLIACMISHPFFMILPAMFFLEIETLVIILFLSLLFKIAVNRFYYKRSLEKYD